MELSLHETRLVVVAKHESGKTIKEIV